MTTITPEWYTLRETSLGPCWEVASLAVVDTNPDLLLSGYPIWLSDEMPGLRAASPEERSAAWTRRVNALAGERAWRAEDPKRTAHGPGAGA